MHTAHRIHRIKQFARFFSRNIQTLDLSITINCACRRFQGCVDGSCKQFCSGEVALAWLSVKKKRMFSPLVFAAFVAVVVYFVQWYLRRKTLVDQWKKLPSSPTNFLFGNVRNIIKIYARKSKYHAGVCK